jgi:hypothetical protein
LDDGSGAEAARSVAELLSLPIIGRLSIADSLSSSLFWHLTVANISHYDGTLPGMTRPCALPFGMRGHPRPPDIGLLSAASTS